MASIHPSPSAPENPTQRAESMRAVMRRYFWCDFSDIIPSLTWDDTDGGA